MKRWLIPLAAVALGFALAGGAPAATAPPKTLCLQFTSIPIFKISLVVKAAGTINTQAGLVKYYTLAGEYFQVNSIVSIPITGTGHVKGTKFHFSLVGTSPNSGLAQTWSAGSSDYDLVTHSGTLVSHYINGQNVTITLTNAIQATDCKASTIPFDAEAE
jgi:hypothetical protein